MSRYNQKNYYKREPRAKNEDKINNTGTSLGQRWAKTRKSSDDDKNEFAKDFNKNLFLSTAPLVTLDDPGKLALMQERLESFSTCVGRVERVVLEVMGRSAIVSCNYKKVIISGGEVGVREWWWGCSRVWGIKWRGSNRKKKEEKAKPSETHNQRQTGQPYGEASANNPFIAIAVLKGVYRVGLWD